MEASEFVIKLKELTPSREKYIKSGASKEYIERDIKSYQCNKRRNIVNEKMIYFKDAILDLIMQYDIKNIEIGMITFSNEISEDFDYYYVGKDEVDPIVIDKMTHEIKVIEHGTPDKHILAYCASSGARFLDALITCEAFLQKMGFDDPITSDPKVVNEVIELCTDKAGGEKYRAFYNMYLEIY
jgi:hypothetical protein